MLCNLCGKHHATVHFKGIVNNQALKLNLCESCAKKKGMVFPFGKSVTSLGDVVATLAESAKLGTAAFSTACKGCGLGYAEFKQTSQMGCSQCYSTFASLTGPLIKEIHGSAQHVGKTYRRTVRQGTPMQELAQLKLELREAIHNEQFEEAAELRDRIQALERQMTRPGEPTLS